MSIVIQELDRYSFYQLVDLRDGLPFYVGQTTSFGRRLQDYLEGKGHSVLLNRRLEELEQLGKLQPEMMRELENRECTRKEALLREAYWIQTLSDQGIALLNTLNNKRVREQHTVYLSLALSKRLKHQSVEEEREISEIVEDALKMYLDRV